MSDATRCGYCKKRVVADTDYAWERSPQGRRVCPHCGAIPADDQREMEAMA